MSPSATQEMAASAHRAAVVLSSTAADSLDKALSAIHDSLLSKREAIQAENALDQRDAATNRIDETLLKRLDLQGEKFEAMVSNINLVRNLPNPLGETLMARELSPGLVLYRVAVPIGVLLIVFESRPEAIVQIVSLAMKTGNAVLLKGGKEANRSNKVIVEAVRAGLAAAGLPVDAVQLVDGREGVDQLLQMRQHIDLVIPRGSAALVEHVMKSTSIPVLGHADGICSVYIDEDARDMLATAIDVVVDSKTQYPSVCNAAETLLIHAKALEEVGVPTAKALIQKGVSLVCDDRAFQVFAKLDASRVERAAPDFGFAVEHLALRMSVKVVDSLDEAVDHINTHGSHHTDVILTSNLKTSDAFVRRVDSAGVYHNCSSRFADGVRYGFGSEVGVSTNKVHARGPVGLQGLLTYKYVARGKGNTVEGYGSNPGQKKFTHKDLPQFVGSHDAYLAASEPEGRPKRVKRG